MLLNWKEEQDKGGFGGKLVAYGGSGIGERLTRDGQYFSNGQGACSLDFCLYCPVLLFCTFGPSV